MKQDKKGTVFLTTMIAMLLMVLVGAFIFELTTQDMHRIGRLKKSLQAQYLAESGLAHAMAVLNLNFNNKDSAANFPQTTLETGTFDATITQSGGRVLVSSLGTVQGVTRTISAEVSPPTISALAYILAGGGELDIKLTANSTNAVTGDIYAAGDIELDAQASGASVTVLGSVYAVGEIDKKGTVTITGTETENWGTAVGFPVFDFSFYSDIAQSNCATPPCNSANDYYYDGDQTFNALNPLPAAPTGGVIFVNGDVTIASTQATTAALVATGKIDITQVKLTVAQYSNYPALLTQTGDILIRSVGNAAQGELVATGLVYSGNNFSLSGNHNPAVSVTGSIVARGTLYQSGTQSSLTMTYIQQNPPGMISSGAEELRIKSYNS